jgi:hypothetical protein
LRASPLGIGFVSLLINASTLFGITHSIPIRQRLYIVYHLVCGRMDNIYSTENTEEEIAMVKTLKIPDDLHKRLAKHGSIGQTFADVIRMLLDYYESGGKGKRPFTVA